MGGGAPPSQKIYNCFHFIKIRPVKEIPDMFWMPSASCMRLGKNLRWHSDHFQFEFLCLLWDKWTTLRLFYWGEPIAKKNTFWDLALIYYGTADFPRWNSEYFKIDFLQFLWGTWTILRLFYWGVCYVLMCIFWDIGLIYVCIGLKQFLEVKSRHHLNRIFMFFQFVFNFVYWLVTH